MTKFFLCGLLLVCLVLVVFSPALRHPFIGWDDDVHCYENPAIRSLDAAHLKSIFTSSVNKTYIPLTILSFALEYHFVKDHPWLYHLDNLLLHACVAILIFLLAVRLGLTQTAAFLAALLFAVHPMHVESVAWVTQRKDVLYSFCYLLSCWYYAGFLKSRHRPQYLWALIFGFLSILAKPMAMSLPLVLFLIEWLVRGRLGRTAWLDKVPFAITIFPIAWITYQMNMRPINVEFGQAALVWLWSLSFYLAKFFFPVNLLALYQLPAPVTLANPAFVFAVGCVAVLAAALMILRRDRWFIFAVAYFFLSIFFLLRFDNRQDLSFVADRFMYLPSMGFCLWMAVRMTSWSLSFPKRIIFWICVALVYILLAFQTFRQTGVWGDEYVLWSRVVQHYRCAAAYNHLGNYFLAQRDYAEALSYFDNGIAIDPTYHKAYGNRGVIHLKEGNFEAAIDDFTTAIRLAPQDAANAYNNRGYVYFQMRNFEAALEDFNRAIETDPAHYKAYMNRATIYKERGAWPEAMADLRRAQILRPDDPGVLRNIQWLEQRMKK